MRYTIGHGVGGHHTVRHGYHVLEDTPVLGFHPGHVSTVDRHGVQTIHEGRLVIGDKHIFVTKFAYFEVDN